MKNRFWYFVHNVVTHPLLVIFGQQNLALRFHNWTIDKMDEPKPNNNLMFKGKSLEQSFDVHIENKDDVSATALWWMVRGSVAAFKALIITHYQITSSCQCRRALGVLHDVL